MKLDCPHCGKQAISMVRKAWLGPAMTATCQVCGKKVGVSYGAAMAAFIPFAAVIVLSSPVEPFSLKAAIWAVGIILTSVTHVRWVPLQKR
jgi:endogenous inhibitor of DNA gyrase (YacG/DUF329 family)